MTCVERVSPSPPCPGLPWPRRSNRTLLAFALTVICSIGPARGENIPETTDRLMLGREIDRDYIDVLGVRGQSGRVAVEKMLGEGFRCRIEVAEEYVPEERPMWHCIKRPSGYAPLCDELWVALRFSPPAESMRTREALLAALDDVKVASARSFCPRPRSASSAHLAARSAAEKSLAAEIERLELKTSGEAAYGKLLREGFHCGFGLAAKAIQSTRMSCTRSPSRIGFCFEATVSIDMTWPAGIEGPKQLYGALPISRVVALESACEIPSLRSAGGKPS